MKKIVLAGMFAALASTAALAQPADMQGQRGGAALTRAELQARVAARFDRLDANRDGFVTRAELPVRADGARGQRGEARRQGRDQRRQARGDRRQEQFARLDANRDGVISREEFSNRPAVAPGDRAERRAMRAQRQGQRGMRGGGAGMFARFGARHFDTADANRDGRVSRVEATQGALALFDRADTNRDGTISREERRSAREALGGQRRRG
jgi:hypothetical protein